MPLSPLRDQGRGFPRPGVVGVRQAAGSALVPKKPPRAVTSSPVVDGSRHLAQSSYPDIPRLWHKPCSDLTGSLDWVVSCQCFL